jgi:hypothetical protein
MPIHDPKSCAIPSPTCDSFDRQLCHDGALIECRCRYCGFRFIGSVSHSLEVVEQIHFVRCTKKKPQARVIPISEANHRYTA